LGPLGAGGDFHDESRKIWVFFSLRMGNNTHNGVTMISMVIVRYIILEIMMESVVVIIIIITNLRER